MENAKLLVVFNSAFTSASNFKFEANTYYDLVNEHGKIQVRSKNGFSFELSAEKLLEYKASKKIKMYSIENKKRLVITEYSASLIEYTFDVFDEPSGAYIFMDRKKRNYTFLKDGISAIKEFYLFELLPISDESNLTELVVDGRVDTTLNDLPPPETKELTTLIMTEPQDQKIKPIFDKQTIEAPTQINLIQPGGKPSKPKRKYSRYFKDVSHLDVIDINRVCELYVVKNSSIVHAVKKLLVAGQRGSKDYVTDLNEASDAIERAIEMHEEDQLKVNHE